jgi:UDP-2-acetamido-2-deoxy-ribo-hexuluronate aminotransferase
MDFIDLKTQYQRLKAEIDAGIQRVLDHGQYILGPEVAELEEKLAAYTGSKYCISVANGTDALQIAQMALGIGPGDEVITPGFTYIATAETVALLGAKPVYVDIDPRTYNLNPALLEAAITPRTKALMPVHLYGQCCDMDPILELARAHRLVVIEDACQAIGAEYRGRRAGSLGDYGCFSFFPSKNLGCYGDGGAIFTNDDNLAQAMREIRVHGQSQRYVHTRVGVGGRMDTLQCAIVLAKLERFEWEVQQRKEIGQRYTDLITSLRAERSNPQESIQTIAIRPERTSVYAQYTVMLPHREAVQKRLADVGVPTAVHYPVPLNEQPAYKHLCCPDCTPVAREMAKRVMSLPMGPNFDISYQKIIVNKLENN